MSSKNERVTVLVADDHPIYREGIVRAIKDRPDLELIEEAADGREALERIRELKPEVAVLDIRMPGLDGTQVLAAMRREGLETKVLFLSAFMEPELAYKTVASGAKGYLSKESSRQEVCEAIVSIARGGTAFAAEAQAGLAEQIQERERSGGPPKLTERESEVLALVSQGLSAPDIGKQIHLSTTTVKSHLHSLYEKLGVSDRAAAVAEAMRRGMLRLVPGDGPDDSEALRAEVTALREELDTCRQLVAQVMDAEDQGRRRIAQLIHDDSLQTLLAANQELIEAAPGRAQVQRAHEVVEAAIGRLREAMMALHPVTLEQGGFEQALGAVAREAARQGGFEIVIDLAPEAIEHEDELLLSIARELLTNAARHSGASAVAVALRNTGEALELEVIDDGTGIAPGRRDEALAEGHIGLASVNERVRAAEGQFDGRDVGRRYAGARAPAALAGAVRAAAGRQVRRRARRARRSQPAAPPRAPVS